MSGNLLSSPPKFIKYNLKAFFSKGHAPSRSPILFLEQHSLSFPILLSQQIYRDQVFLHTKVPEGNLPCEGLLINLPKVIVRVKTADGVPILLATKAGLEVRSIYVGSLSTVLH